MENNLLDKVSKLFRYLEHNYKFKTKIGLEGSISDLIKEYPDTSRFLLYFLFRYIKFRSK